MKSPKLILSALLLMFVVASVTSCKTKEKCAAYSSIAKPLSTSN